MVSNWYRRRYLKRVERRKSQELQDFYGGVENSRTLWIYTAVLEDHRDLYGFYDRPLNEKNTAKFKKSYVEKSKNGRMFTWTEKIQQQQEFLRHFWKIAGHPDNPWNGRNLKYDLYKISVDARHLFNFILFIYSGISSMSQHIPSTYIEIATSMSQNPCPISENVEYITYVEIRARCRNMYNRVRMQKSVLDVTTSFLSIMINRTSNNKDNRLNASFASIFEDPEIDKSYIVKLNYPQVSLH